ncbi:Zinc finger CCCH domain-containing protein 6 [Striga hermonthica]|uniref:Zinc finger CCCH domain-containing protein 6 n=1 Tax=Striga hermonthica TaxID=68872 RepID=A0A9N7NMW5_STRHE|nr:Zinc finger CCCH domain-containing protein 6 [Striga hermonthica]
MRRSHKTKKVSWASDLNLCQVRLFTSEESPSRVALGTQDQWPIDNKANDDLPPGFEGCRPTSMWRVDFKLPQIPLVKWRCPRRFELNPEWQVVAGEESNEVKAQSRHEMRVLEAVYPRPSSIPPNPHGLLDARNSTAFDKTIRVIPITPIEEHDAMLDTWFNTTTLVPSLTKFSPQSSTEHTDIDAKGTTQEVHKADILASISSLLSKCDKEKLVDQELLVKILSDPKLVNQLIENNGVRTPNVKNETSVGMKNVGNFDAQNLTSNSHNFPYNCNVMPWSINNTVNRIEHWTPSALVASNGTLHPPIPVEGQMKKDVNYYKNLIRQHGNENENFFNGQEQRHFDFGKSREPKQKVGKSCIYFNSQKGCRNGVRCNFQHGVSTRKVVNGFAVDTRKVVNGFAEVRSAKRVKLGGVITGR